MAELLHNEGYDTLGDIIRDGLDVLFVGYNPSLPAMRMRHYYANPGNCFWELLFEVGFLPRVFRDPGDDVRLLEYGLGLTDVVKRPSANASVLTAGEFKAGFVRLDGLLRRYRPRFACLVGRRLLDMQRRLGPAAPPGVEFCAVLSTSGLNNGRQDERRAEFLGLKRRVDALRNRT
jgi:TDG/mug DNA glycosylase family protein